MPDDAAWLDEIPLESTPPDMRVGLRRVAADDWLVFDGKSAAELTLRRQLIQEHPETVLLEPGFDLAVEELYRMVAEAASSPHDEGVGGREALVAAALVATEDQCLLAKRGDQWDLVGGSLVFANYWSLADKIGGSLSSIHEPVEGYEDMLAARVVSFFDRMGTETISMRRNWFLHDNAEYFLPRPNHSPFQIAPADHGLITGLTVRSERQTLRRLPESGAVVFTIKTQMVAMADAILRAGFGERMLAWALTATPRAQHLKGTAGCHDALVRFLQHTERDS